MADWWYVKDELKIGPISQEALLRLRDDGNIDADTMIWQEGFSDWTRLGDVNVIGVSGLIHPSVSTPTEPDYPLAKKWPRFFARLFDIWLEVSVIAFIAGFILAKYSASLFEFIQQPFTSQLFGCLCLPFALILDALIYQVFGNTIGKKILSLDVRKSSGTALTFTEYLSRNSRLWFKGFGFGIPFVSLFTMANEGNRIDRELPASYDGKTNDRVRSKPITIGRKIVFGLAFVTVFIGLKVLDSQEKESYRKATSEPTFAWINPVTKVRVKLDSKWNYAVAKDNAGVDMYTFKEWTNRAIAVVAMEKVPDATLGDYAKAFQKNNETKMAFTDGGTFSEKNGHQTWEASGTIVHDNTNRLHVEVVQIGTVFWRVLTVQSMPYVYTEPLVSKVEAALMTTIK